MCSQCDETEDETPTEPEEGDLTTSDHEKFYQYGKCVVIVGGMQDMWSALDQYMEKEKFWPDVWFISDHGNAHLMERPVRD